MLNPNKDPKGAKEFERLNFGYTSAVGFFICCGAGYWLDQKYNREFLFTLIGFFLGISLIAFEVWKIIQDLNKPEQKKK